MKKRGQTKTRPLYADLEKCVTLLSRFANRWACHDEHCAWNTKSAPCTCGYDLAVRTLSERMTAINDEDLVIRLAIAHITQQQRVIS